MTTTTKLTKAGKALLAVIADGEWHLFGGRRERLVCSLGDAGLVQYRYAFSVPGQPTRGDVRLTPAGEPAGHISNDR
jgi:hypothetical protein